MKKILSAVLGSVLAAALVSGIAGISADTGSAGTAVRGDIDNDGTVSAADVDILQKFLVNKAELSDTGAADYNADGKIDVFDAVAVRRAISAGSPVPPVSTAEPVTTVNTTISTAVTTTTAIVTTAATTAATTTAAATTAAITTAATTTAATVTTTVSSVTTASAVTTSTAVTTTVNEQEKINAYVNRVAELVNEERAKKGIAPVTVDPVMVDAAMLRAKEISELFSHTRPDGTSCFTVFDDFNIKCSYCSENIAAGSPTPEETMDQWIHSEGHYNNLMSPQVSEIGIGYCYAPNTRYGYYWVQLFRKP